MYCVYFTDIFSTYIWIIFSKGTEITILLWCFHRESCGTHRHICRINRRCVWCKHTKCVRMNDTLFDNIGSYSKRNERKCDLEPQNCIIDIGWFNRNDDSEWSEMKRFFMVLKIFTHAQRLMIREILTFGPEDGRLNEKFRFAEPSDFVFSSIFRGFVFSSIWLSWSNCKLIYRNCKLEFFLGSQSNCFLGRVGIFCIIWGKSWWISS